MKFRVHSDDARAEYHLAGLLHVAKVQRWCIKLKTWAGRRNAWGRARSSSIIGALSDVA